MATKEITEYLRSIRKQGHIDNPLPKEHYQKMAKKSAIARRKKKTKLLTGSKKKKIDKIA